MMFSIVKDSTGLEKVILREPLGATVQVHLFGGQVTSWRNDKGDELLFLSNKAIFKPPKAIRGGIPICFPEFANTGALEQHGFARNRLWSVESASPGTSNKPMVDLILRQTPEDLKMWPHSFELRLRIALGRGGDLTQTVRVRNTDSKPFTFTFTFQTYFSVSDISEVRIEGLETLDFLDNLRGKERFTEQGDALTFDGEVDRIYLDAPTKIAIIDHEKKRTFIVKKEGLPDAVVWNPWDKRSKAISDFGDEEYMHTVCVEPSVIGEPITLKPGEEWRGRQELSAVHSSYCSGQLDPDKVIDG